MCRPEKMHVVEKYSLTGFRSYITEVQRKDASNRLAPNLETLRAIMSEPHTEKLQFGHRPSFASGAPEFQHIHWENVPCRSYRHRR